MAKVMLTDGTEQHYTIKFSDVGYGSNWDEVEYSDFKKVTAKLLSIPVEQIQWARL